MPLEEGSSREVVGRNIKTEMEHGKPQKQAVAIALNKAGLSNKDANDVTQPSTAMPPAATGLVPAKPVEPAQLVTTPTAAPRGAPAAPAGGFTLPDKVTHADMVAASKRYGNY
jgi:hypothetical protein